MRNMKQIFRLCYLSLLRFRILYAAGAIRRVSRHFSSLYQNALSRALWKLSLWECQYKEAAQRYLAAKEKEGIYEPKH